MDSSTVELKTSLARELWRWWKIYGLAIGVYFVLVRPLFGLSGAQSLGQAWLDSLLPTLVALGLASLLFGLWSVCAIWFIDKLILRRYPADLPVTQLRPRLGLACLGIAMFGCFVAVVIGALASFQQAATDMYQISGPGFFLAALLIEERVKAWQSARQSA